MKETHSVGDKNYPMATVECAGGAADAEYFESYDDLDVHHLMLKDTVRVQTYKKAIQSCAHYFKDKVVMDVGAGTGILSVFCAQAGAKTIYAVEPSSLANMIPKVAAENHVLGVIKVLKQRAEDVSLPNGERVDVIVSEWMGFYLLHEGMLDSVLVARDLHLKPGGKIFPDKATIWCAPCSLPNLYDFWNDVEGCHMQSVGLKWRQQKSRHPQIVEISSKDLLSEGKEISSYDLNVVTSTDLDSTSKTFLVPSDRDGKYQGLGIWFTCSFPMSDVILSTSPAEPVTHWKQTVIMLSDCAELEKGAPIAWQLKLEKNADSRQYNIEFTELDPENIQHPVPCKCYMTKCIVIRAYHEQIEEMNEEDVIDMAEQGDEDAEKYSNCDSEED